MPFAFFQKLRGTWRFQRTIKHITNGTKDCQATGTATFKELTPNVLAYHEKGSLTNPKVDFYRDYQYRYTEDTIGVYFDDGRLFHTLQFKDQEACAEHLCGRDTYRVAYRIVGDDRFEVVYRVEGPEKSYVSSTVFDKDR